MIPVQELGWKAHAALGRTSGVARVLAALSESIYLTAGDTIVWLGRSDAPLHPRAMLAREPLAASGDVVTIDGGAARRWAPPTTTGSASSLVAGARTLVRRIGDLGTPDGFGALLAGATPPFPLDGAAPRADALRRACASDDPRAAVEAATALLGLGPGLTPSGDDYVGGAFFARAQLARLGACDGRAWAGAAAEVLTRAGARTHPISVALLGDMLEGHGHAPLHELGSALAEGADLDVARDAARRLARIGHSSGWDMLAGFVAGAVGVQ